MILRILMYLTLMIINAALAALSEGRLERFLYALAAAACGALFCAYSWVAS